jgi:50S ribosomal protein L16 3-hydroxylase
MAGRKSSTPAPAPANAVVPLGAMSPAAFLRRFWHKEALLVRRAISGFTGPFSDKDLFALAQRDDIESRLVVREGSGWNPARAPFRRADFTALRATGRFWCRASISSAPMATHCCTDSRSCPRAPRRPDGELRCAWRGVGPHVDSYDVFLLQGLPAAGAMAGRTTSR